MSRSRGGLIISQFLTLLKVQRIGRQPVHLPVQHHEA